MKRYYDQTVKETNNKRLNDNVTVAKKIVNIIIIINLLSLYIHNISQYTYNTYVVIKHCKSARRSRS